MTYAPSEANGSGDCYVVAPAFAEEMNRSRDLLRAFGHKAASRNAVTLIPDLRGTGDSPGDFGNYSVESWCDDLTAVVEFARERYRHRSVTLLGIRFGALLAARISNTLAIKRLLLWQPVVEGKRMTREFLRIWSAANMNSNTTVRERLEDDGTLEVAGYRVSNQLIQEVDSMSFELDSARSIALRWLETGPTLSPRSERTIEALRHAGHDIDAVSVDCPPFWRVQERVDATKFVTASFGTEPGGSHD